MNKSATLRKMACAFLLFFFSLLGPPAFAGIPEPGIIMYGQVRDTAGTLLTSGELLTWTFTPVAGGSPVTVNTLLKPIEGAGGNWSYWVLVPMETEMPDFPVSSNTIPLTSSPVSYTRTGQVEGTNISFTDTVNISVVDRGTIQLVSLGTTGVTHQLITLSQPQEGGTVSPDCSGTCTYDEGMDVTLTATEKPDYLFSYWTGCASQNGSQCGVTMDEDTNVTAHFILASAQTAKLTINTIGSGAGTVTSSPGGIDCGAACIHNFNKGEIVTLTTTPANGSAYAGWSGDADCADGILTMDSDKTCTAIFNDGNTPPEAFSQTITTKTGTPVAITLTANDADGDAVSFSLVDHPVNGILTGTASDLVYTPGANYAGTDSFTFKAHDGFIESAIATVTITVSEGVQLTLTGGWNLFGWIAGEGCFEGVTPLESEYASGGVLNQMPTLKDCLASSGLNDTDYLVVIGPGGKVYAPGSPFNTLKSLLPGKAYWIYMNGDIDLTLPGSILDSSASLQLTPG